MCRSIVPADSSGFKNQRNRPDLGRSEFGRLWFAIRGQFGRIYILQNIFVRRPVRFLSFAFASVVQQDQELNQSPKLLVANLHS